MAQGNENETHDEPGVELSRQARQELFRLSLPKNVPAPLLLPRGLTGQQQRSILDPSTGRQWRNRNAAARAMKITPADVDRKVAGLELHSIRSGTQIVTDAEADFAASGLAWRTWWYWFKRGVKFAELEPEELAGVVAELKRRAAAKRRK